MFPNNSFVICGQRVRHPLTELFHLSSLFQMPNDHRRDNVEFFSSFSCSCKTISFDGCPQRSLSTSDGQPLGSSSSRISSPLQNFLKHLCTVCLLAIPGPNEFLMLRIASAALQPILNLKITHICLLFHVISIV